MIDANAVTSRISIHAPVKGATSNLITLLFQHYYFNPRTREGCDVGTVTVKGNGTVISIHAPVKGATTHD